MQLKTLTPRVSPEEGELIKEAAYRARVSQAIWMRRRLGLADLATTNVEASELFAELYPITDPATVAGSTVEGDAAHTEGAAT